MSGIPPQLPPNILDALQIFANTAWHNPAAFGRIHRSSTSRDVAYLHLQDHSVALQYLFGSAVAGHHRILVRDEYRDALQALHTEHAYDRGAYITGQPGIGKTCFLVYALIERLREHKPVAVQLRTADPFYAFFTHTCTLHSLSDPSPLVQEGVWALSDLRVSTTTPLDIFLDVSEKVVQAAPPCMKHWGKWSQYRDAEMFVMDIWSDEEIADLSSLLELDAERMTTLATRWGGVPRTLQQQYMKDEPQQDWEMRRIATRLAENHTAFFPALHTLALDAEDVGMASAIFFVLPFKNHAGSICRCRYVVRVPTVTLENVLAIALQQMQSSARIDTFRLMSVQPGTRICARNIFVNWFSSLWTFPGWRDCNWSPDPWNSALQKPYYDNMVSAGRVRVTHDATTTLDPPYFCVLSTGEFPGIDCLLVTQSGIFAIQIPMSSQPLPSSPQIGLDKLRATLPQGRNNIPWYMLFVGISEELARNASRHWKDKLTNVSVEWYAVDPTEVGIASLAYTEDDEPEQ